MRTVPLPAEVQAIDEPRVAAGVARRPLVVTSGWLVPRGSTAWTLGRIVIVRPSRAGDAGLLAHECVHVAQWGEQGVVGFLRAYLSAYLRARLVGDSHWEAYRTIPAEVEAYRVETAVAPRGATAFRLPESPWRLRPGRRPLEQ